MSWLCYAKGMAYRQRCRLAGHDWPGLIEEYENVYDKRSKQEITEEYLSRVLLHCLKNVPFFRENLQISPSQVESDPREALRQFPILTRDVVRGCHDQLKSEDLRTRKWYYNTSGGTTGEPLRLIQDKWFYDVSTATALYYSRLLGRNIGEPELLIWGSERDVFGERKSIRSRFDHWLMGTRAVNAFAFGRAEMLRAIRLMNRQRPRLIVAYAQAVFELARFVDMQGLHVEPQRAIVTTAGTLYGFMKDTIRRAFSCPAGVFDRYGSREVSLIGCELPDSNGLVVPPWLNYVEVLDDDGNPVADGNVGNIVITNLANFAMPLVRYVIGDRGNLMNPVGCIDGGQRLGTVRGRIVDTFKAVDGTLVDGEYFTHLMYLRDWVRSFQVVQSSLNLVTFRVVRTASATPQEDLDEIKSKTKLALGDECSVVFEFVDDILPSKSGKTRYTISEI
ncbi:MAG: hypothetical protein R3E01_14055 [Pirellulaceae bacterium]